MTRSVFGFLSKKPGVAEIVGPQHCLRLPRYGDYDRWFRLRRESRSFLQPWEPEWGRDDLSEWSFRARILRNEQEYASGTAIPLLIFDRAEETLFGGLTIGHIRRGAAQTCMIGYWMGAEHAGKGHMRIALDMTIRHIFDRVCLHRIEAACIAENAASIGLLEGAGFQYEGEMREFLKINGMWRNHYLYALLKSDKKKD